MILRGGGLQGRGTGRGYEGGEQGEGSGDDFGRILTLLSQGALDLSVSESCTDTIHESISIFMTQVQVTRQVPNSALHLLSPRLLNGATGICTY